LTVAFGSLGFLTSGGALGSAADADASPVPFSVCLISATKKPILPIMAIAARATIIHNIDFFIAFFDLIHNSSP